MTEHYYCLYSSLARLQCRKNDYLPFNKGEIKFRKSSVKPIRRMFLILQEEYFGSGKFSDCLFSSSMIGHDGNL